MNDSLVYVLPILLGIIVLVFFVNKLMVESPKNKNAETASYALQLRLHAYERLTLLLERTKPASLILRVPADGDSVIAYNQRLVAKIRQEFNHNLSQQIYVSEELWQKIENTINNATAEINKMAFEANNAGLLADAFAKKYLVENTINSEIYDTLASLKKESQSYL